MHKDEHTLEHRVEQLRMRMQQFRLNYPEIFSTASKPSTTPITGAVATHKTMQDRLNMFNVHGVKQ